MIKTFEQFNTLDPYGEENWGYQENLSREEQLNAIKNKIVEENHYNMIFLENYDNGNPITYKESENVVHLIDCVSFDRVYISEYNIDESGSDEMIYLGFYTEEYDKLSDEIIDEIYKILYK